MKEVVRGECLAPDGSQLQESAGRPARSWTTPSTTGRAGWVVPTALLLLSVIPLASGVLRVTELTGGPARMPPDARFAAWPRPVEVRIVSVSVYAVLGAFQFAAGFRRRWPGWHRVVGRLVVLSGLLVGLSALWMTVSYPRPAGTGDLLYLLRLLFGSAMVASIVLGVSAIRQGDVSRHRAWMTRGYAIALGAGTQVFTGLAGTLVFGKPDALSGALLMGAGWGINLAVAEWIIRRQAAPPAPPAPTERAARRVNASPVRAAGHADSGPLLLELRQPAGPADPNEATQAPRALSDVTSPQTAMTRRRRLAQAERNTP